MSMGRGARIPYSDFEEAPDRKQVSAAMRKAHPWHGACQLAGVFTLRPASLQRRQGLRFEQARQLAVADLVGELKLCHGENVDHQFEPQIRGPLQGAVDI